MYYFGKPVYPFSHICVSGDYVDRFLSDDTVKTVPEESHSVKVSVGDMIAEISEGISEQMMTSLIRTMRNA